MYTTSSRPMLTKLATLAVAFGLALSLMIGLTNEAYALPKDDILSGADDCTHRGQTYSEGAVVEMDDGKKYKCHNGHWDEARVAPPETGSGWQLPTYPTEAAPINYYP